MRGLISLLPLIFLAACSARHASHHEAKALISAHCAACHQIPGVALAVGRVGPPLAGLRRQQIIAGFFTNTPGMLAQWIEHPQRMLPGNAMPEMGLTHTQAMTIVDYLYTMDGP